LRQAGLKWAKVLEQENRKVWMLDLHHSAGVFVRKQNSDYSCQH